MKKILTTLLLCLAIATTGMAQKLQLSKFETLTTSPEAKTNPRKDRITKDNCALLKIYAPKINEYTFEGKIEGDPIYKNGEAWVYLRPGTDFLNVKHGKYGSVRKVFEEPFESEVVYSIHVDVVNNKTRTLVMPTIGIGKCMNYGIMVGLVKKWGGYIKGKYNFKSLSEDMECTDQGYTKDGNEIWFDGNSDKSRLAVTGGVLYRLKETMSTSLYLYGGLGYGNYKYCWETTDKQWAKNADASHAGTEIEVGAIGRWKNFAFGLGIETCTMRYFELNLGIGVVF